MPVGPVYKSMIVNDLAPPTISARLSTGTQYIYRLRDWPDEPKLSALCNCVCSFFIIYIYMMVLKRILLVERYSSVSNQVLIQMYLHIFSIRRSDKKTTATVNGQTVIISAVTASFTCIASRIPVCAACYIRIKYYFSST